MSFRAAVLIPTYNNARTLREVVEGVLGQVDDVLVVDDGSTDATPEILEGFGDRLRVLRQPGNRGKGRALRDGFQRLREEGRTHAVVVDSDGQHFPEDLPRLLEAARRNPRALVVGERAMGEAGAPRRSRFGLWCSNLLLRLLAGVRLADTQSGFRVYPLEEVTRLNLEGERFDLELEVLVKAGWAGIPFERVPIRTTYTPKAGRVSHFRPLRDFFHIAWQMLRLLARRSAG